MVESIETLARRFETGSLGRREFVAAVVAATGMAAGPTSLRAAHAPADGAVPLRGTDAVQAGEVLRAASLNHVTLAVSDIERSREFYGRVLDTTVISRQPNGINLGLGNDGFRGMYDIDPPTRIHHFCVGVEDFEIEKTADELRSRGVTPTIRQDRPELYFQDPDGVTVQLSSVDYRG